MNAEAKLLDGTTIEIVAAAPSDAESVLAFMQHLSALSRHERFFAGLGPDALAHEMRRELRDPRNVSLLARARPDRRIVGHAFAAPSSADCVEVAFAVADEVQHHGIGTVLLDELLAVLRSRGIRRFEATTLPENRTMREVFEAAGFTLSADASGVRALLDDERSPSP